MTTTTPGLLDGKAILIVGASQGIGAAAARHFAAEGACLVTGATLPIDGGFLVP